MHICKKEVLIKWWVMRNVSLESALSGERSGESSAYSAEEPYTTGTSVLYATLRD